LKRDLPDFFYVADAQLGIHARLQNWARYVLGRGTGWQSPIWKLGKPNGRQWHQPEYRDPVNTLDGHAIEKAVGLLPHDHREALRWYYVHRSSPNRIRRVLGVTNDGLMRLVVDGRQMLVNRKA
jgi:hypothetical protein